MARDSLSSNHFSHEGQLTDALNWLQTNNPLQFKLFLAEFPEWESVANGPDMLEDLDPEWPMWATDWLEASTAIYWEDGEPWVEI